MRPNVIGDVRHAAALPLIVLVLNAPMEWMFIDGLVRGEPAGYLWLVGVFVVPTWAALPFAFWRDYSSRRRRRRQEFRE